MSTKLVKFLICITIGSLLPVLTSAAEVTVFDMADPSVKSPGAPESSDVLMRSLFLRKKSDKSEHDTLQALEDFHATGLVWAYIKDPADIATVKASGRFFQGAVNSSISGIPDRPKNASAEAEGFIEKYSAKKLDGTPCIQPWKRHWPNEISATAGCCSNPEFLKAYIEQLKYWIDIGATMLQRDEVKANARMPEWGGCFCKWCMKGFRQYVKNNTTPQQRMELGIDNIETFNYRKMLIEQGAPVGDDFKNFDGGKLKEMFIDYQEQTTIDFHKKAHKALNEYAGFYVPFSANNHASDFSPVMQEFDWFIGELTAAEATPEHIYNTIKKARKLGKTQAISMPKRNAETYDKDPEGWEQHTKKTIAMAYASGGFCLVPWDVWMSGKIKVNGQWVSTPRYFGTPEQYGDIFGFIRDNAEYFDGYGEAAVCGGDLVDHRWSKDNLPVEVDVNGVYAMTRVKNGDASAPAVVHLVDWRDETRAFKINLNTELFFGKKELDVKLLTPQNEPVQLASGNIEKITIPAINPWGLLVIEPEK